VLLFMVLILLEQSELVSIGFNESLMNSLNYFHCLSSADDDANIRRCMCAVFAGGSGIGRRYIHILKKA
jgi:hypothetical protein